MRTIFAVALLGLAAHGQTLRPPATPLVVHDPYFSIWLPGDDPTLTDSVHWTGRKQALCALIKLGGQTYRLLGSEPADAPAARLVTSRVTATATAYEFRCGSAGVELSFVTPALPADLELLSRPVTYFEWRAWDATAPERELAAEFYLDISASVAVNDPAQSVVGRVLDWAPLATAAVGSLDQAVLQKRGDDLRIDWGAAYLASDDARAGAVYGPALESRSAFLEGRAAEVDDEASAPMRVEELFPVIALRWRAGPARTDERGAALLAYDDEWSIRYFGENLRPYWRRGGMDARTLLTRAAADRVALLERCRAFDGELYRTLAELGGTRYAELCVLSYRQCLGGNKLCADSNGRPLLFPKENFSNGCIATVDVIYPMAPLFLLLGADLTKAMLVPVLDYGSSERWTFPFAPHDLGTYPHATGQVYGGGERSEQNQMPVEESANLLLLLAALAEREGHAQFAAQYWPTLERWARYLLDKGFDPENQLCTDDFTGHLAHNVNLSCKAILALGAFAQLAERRGLRQLALEFRSAAERFAVEWQARAGSAGATRLAFDKPDTWSQKYNLVWDRVLGLELFPDEVRARELAHYRKLQNAYGLPLDSRASFTKIDWTSWSACLGSREDFEALIAPLWKYVHETPDRVPICDWSDTLTARKINMIARPVIGGLFMRALHDAPTWKRWFERGAHGSGEWAALPILHYESIVPAADGGEFIWSYTTDAPLEGWHAPGYDTSRWKQGAAGFGTPATPGALVRTEWSSRDIWLRREFQVPEVALAELQLLVHHDEDAEIYVNGVLAADLQGYTTGYEVVAPRPVALATVRPGPNLIALHCRQTSGGQYIDLGLVRVRRAERK